jgi:predicted amidohydrolase
VDDFRIDPFKVRAGENIACTAMANYPGSHGNHYQGRSVAFTSAAELAVEAGKEEDVYMASLDVDEVRRRRRTKIWGAAYRKPHRYRVQVSPEKDSLWKRIDGNGQPWKAEDR